MIEAAEEINLPQVFYRWRSDTAKLQDLLIKHGLLEENNVIDTVTNNVCVDLIHSIHQPQPGSTMFVPRTIFQSAESDDDQLSLKYAAFQSSVKRCVEKAVRLYSVMRLGRAQYNFEFVPNDPFRNSEAQVAQEQRSGDDTVADGEFQIAFCRFPAFVKYGDDLGETFERKVLFPAEVILEGVPMFGNMSPHGERSSTAENDDGAFPRLGSGAEGRNGEGGERSVTGENEEDATKKNQSSWPFKGLFTRKV
jgi:hypothetical protein